MLMKKIPMSKDNDGAEKGRGSLFKRQLQRPIVALTFNFVTAIGIIFMNKVVLKTIGFHFPIILTLIHYLISWLLMAILKAFSILPSSPPKSASFSVLISLAIVISLSTALANISLKHNSVGFYQMSKIAATPSVVVAEFILYNKRIQLSRMVVLTVVSIGVAVATVTDLQFHLFGACVALAWIVPSAVNKIIWSNLQQHKDWSALALMWKTTPMTLFFLVVMIPCFDPPGVFSFNWNFRSTLVILMSAVLGFLLQWSGALALGATSATTQVVLGQLKTCVVLLGNYYLFGSNPGKTSIYGAFMAIAAMSVYTYLNLQPPSLPKSKPIRENGQGKCGGESV